MKSEKIEIDRERMREKERERERKKDKNGEKRVREGCEEENHYKGSLDITL